MIQTNHQRLLSDGWAWDPETKRYRDPVTGEWLDEARATEWAYWRDWVRNRDRLPGKMIVFELETDDTPDSRL